MAPQLGMGTFRILTFPGGTGYSYAYAPNANTEIWAMRRTDFVQPSSTDPLVSILIERMNPPPADFCNFIAALGGATVFDIVEHTKRAGCVNNPIHLRRRGARPKPRK